MASLTFPSPVGPLTLTEEDGHITRLRWDGAGHDETPVLLAAATQLGEYFAGQRQRFDLPLAPNVTPAQRRFLDALIAIPYGETRRYGDLARDLGISAQAAGQACGANPIAILIPCHRVLATDSLGGFSALGGIETKVALLRLEGAASLLL
ncbi:MAG: methylated-DNA--[protein]-cysteine S-methyltransferase [Paracoccaceae bacterium]